MLRAFALAIIFLFAAPAGAQKERETPYWASISAGKAMMRTGPGKNYPATWLYQRADLPIKVVEVYPNWRRVQDPEGTTGWMLVHLLSDTRTGLVTGTEPRPMHAEPDAGSRIAYRAAPGVVGRLVSCDGGWCLFDVGGKRGYIQKSHFWGADPGESF
ncbi:MAG TPA: SH3 domain-containing protein [Allosphingosinicella sp.]|uniref:SH3 domain-containing protein n=1 Tax=Allosphingosinicella sp. TaxID=2823234 RepID=UPI002EDA4D59